MHRLDGGDDGDVGLAQPRQRLDLPCMVHAQFEHAIGMAGRHPRQAERHAPMVVQVAGGGEGRVLGGKRGAQRLLGAGLANRAGDRDHRAAEAHAGIGAQRGQRLRGVVDHQQRRVRVHGLRRPMHHGGGRALAERVGNVVVAVEVGAGQGDEEISGFDAATVDRHAACHPVADRRSTGRCRRFLGGPQGILAHLESPAAAALPMSLAAVLACSASSKGWTSSPTI